MSVELYFLKSGTKIVKNVVYYFTFKDCFTIIKKNIPNKYFNISAKKNTFMTRLIFY